MFDFGNANDGQRQAISTTEGPVLITAGPGTGKTYTLVQRAIYLIEERGVKPEDIFIATFTEKAAKELITRITNELASRNITVNVNEMYVGTFHSLCLRIIKEHLEYTRLKKNYRLLDTFDQQYLVFRNIYKFRMLSGIENVMPKGGAWKWAQAICEFSNNLTEEVVDIDAMLGDHDMEISVIAKVVNTYQAMLDEETTKRLINVADELNGQLQHEERYTGFEVYNVNNYDFFRNPIEAKNLVIEALEIQPFVQGNVWDGELDGRMVKIMPVNRIATKADLEELKANLPYKIYEKRKEENPRQPVELITIVCMGHEPDLKASLEQSLSEYKVDVQIVDILRDKSELQLKREAEAEVVHEGNKLVIRSFYPMNLMQKLSLQKEYVKDWKQLVESIMIDWNYDGVVMQPTVTDVPDKKEFVAGLYDIPDDAGTIKVKITDLLSESLEVEV